MLRALTLYELMYELMYELTGLWQNGFLMFFLQTIKFSVKFVITYSKGNC